MPCKAREPVLKTGQTRFLKVFTLIQEFTENLVQDGLLLVPNCPFIPRHTRYSSFTRLLQRSSRTGQWTITLWTFSPSLSLTFLPLPPHPKGGDVKREGRGGVGETENLRLPAMPSRHTSPVPRTAVIMHVICLYLHVLEGGQPGPG